MYIWGKLYLVKIKKAQVYLCVARQSLFQTYIDTVKKLTLSIWNLYLLERREKKIILKKINFTTVFKAFQIKQYLN